MRTLIAVTSLAMALTPALAQKTDRLPDTDGPKVVRTIPITPSFEQRWFGPAASDRWLSNQPPPSDRFTLDKPNVPVETKNAPAASAARTAAILPVAKPSIRKPDQATCLRHSLRTVWTGQSWRCRR